MTDAHTERPLPAQSREGLVRVGHTVRRPCTRVSPSIHALLLHLEDAGFDRCPRFLGLDAQGREILSYIEGEVGHGDLSEGYWSDAALLSAARLLRAYHDAVAGFVAPQDAQWLAPVPTHIDREIIAHNDVAPYNCVYRGQRPFALIDFDAAAPASRAWDLAYAAYRFVPLSDPCQRDAAIRGEVARTPMRLQMFCDTYGLEDRTELVALVLERVSAIRAYTVEAVSRPGPNADRIRREGHLAFYDRDLRFLRRCGRDLQAGIG